MYGALYLPASLLILRSFAKRHFRITIIGLAVFIAAGLLSAFIGATIVGYCLAALYNASFLRMSTYVPALWGLLQALVVLYFAVTRHLVFTG
jgi:hypothetical protein